MPVPLGVYISVPFCRTKCSYCNFASDVFSRVLFQQYVSRVVEDISRASRKAQGFGARFDAEVDSIYLGGGTPTLLDPQQLESLFSAIGREFAVTASAEITVECAPGTLTPSLIETLQRCRVNRVSLGVQSFVDQESAAVGRLHKATTVHEDLLRLRQAGISNINADLIAGLPHQTAASWDISLNALVDSGVPHASVYMLEVDEDSRLGRELMAGGTRYHAHFVPDEDVTAAMYEVACERLPAAGIKQYEISNFARSGFESHHNLKYWTRQPYLGFGVDAHSMLLLDGNSAIRFSSPDSLDVYVAGETLPPVRISSTTALEESFFLGLRLNRGIDLHKLNEQFPGSVAQFSEVVRTHIEDGLLEQNEDVLRLTSRGRLLSNEVFASFLLSPEAAQT
jgi:oxygen-independent coproporphyrinogen-3 oxidase